MSDFISVCVRLAQIAYIFALINAFDKYVECLTCVCRNMPEVSIWVL